MIEPLKVYHTCIVYTEKFCNAHAQLLNDLEANRPGVMVIVLQNDSYMASNTCLQLLPCNQLN